MKKQELARIRRRENKRRLKKLNKETYNDNDNIFGVNPNILYLPLSVDIFYIIRELTSGY